MNVVTEKDLQIFYTVDEYCKKGLVQPYEKDILDFLANHTDYGNTQLVKSNYLDSLLSTYSIGKCYTFCRYLALAMKYSDFSIHEGTLSSLYDGNFTHAWIETGDYVYDVSFVGKWPKVLYYNLFSPVTEKFYSKRRLETSTDFTNLSFRNIPSYYASQQKRLKYIDWYHYMKSMMNDKKLSSKPVLTWKSFPY